MDHGSETTQKRRCSLAIKCSQQQQIQNLLQDITGDLGTTIEKRSQEFSITYGEYWYMKVRTNK
jgi:hypothetical protein